MKNSIKTRWIVFAVILVLAFSGAACYGNTVKKSYQNDVDFEAYSKTEGLKAICDEAYLYDADYDMYGEGEKVHNFQDLERYSDIIVRGKLSDSESRRIFQGCLLSQIDVAECRKGDIKAGEKIHMFEPADCRELENIVLCSDGYTPMEKGKEYILFLKKIKNSHFSKDKYIYLPVNLTYGKYRVDTSMPALYQGNQVSFENYAETEKLLPFREAAREEVLLFEKDKYQLYLDLKKSVIANYM